MTTQIDQTSHKDILESETPVNSVRLQRARDMLESQIKLEVDQTKQTALQEGLAVAGILQDLEMPDAILCSAILTPLVQMEALSPEHVQKKFSREIKELVQDLQRLDSYSHFSDIDASQGLSPKQAEGLRKLLLAIVDDIRLVLVRLAQQLHRLRVAKIGRAHV